MSLNFQTSNYCGFLLSLSLWTSLDSGQNIYFDVVAESPKKLKMVFSPKNTFSQLPQNRRQHG
jgi:hypothetical protein